MSLDRFPCISCGICCQYLDEGMYGDLRLENGACKHFDPEQKLCKVYDQRPLKCRIDDYYALYLNHSYSKKQYYELNAQACLRFMELEGDQEALRAMLQQQELINQMEDV